MKTFAAIPALLLTAACATAAAAPIEQLGFLGNRPEVTCDIELSFGSACCGINTAAHEGLTRYIQGRSGITRAVEWAWGREGERTICLATASASDSKAIFAELSAKRYPSTNHSATAVTRGDERVTLD